MSREFFEKNTPVVYHFRKTKDDGSFDAKGGATFVYDPSREVAGYAFCNDKDQFNKKLGITIAKGRLKKEKSLILLKECNNKIKEIKETLAEIYSDHLEGKK